MRRLLRWAFNLSAAVSTALFVVVCVLWVRSRFVRDQLDFVTQHNLPRGGWMWRVWEARSFDGQLVVGTGHRGYYSPANIRRLKAVLTAKNPPLWQHIRGRRGDAYLMVWGHERPWNRLGFCAEQRWDVSYGWFASGSCRWLGAPHWFLACLFAPLPLARSHSRWRRWLMGGAKPGHCPSCGYDLRATPGGGGPLLARCPECGAEPGAKA